jgi:hypothetical protein
MRGNGFRIEASGLSEMIQALHDIQTKGPARAQRELDLALDKTAETSRELAHLHSGRLKESQSHSSDSSDPREWQGQISYDGRGAAFEIQRGGDHSEFIDSLAGLSAEDFRAALDSMFRDLSDQAWESLTHELGRPTALW